ncbi:MAG: coenzyme F420 hydrogenase subunit gamma [Methanobacteriaceae archaeon]|jgi:coenzyme F420 hydrogenase subunit gamma|nr:coenzyme F420 hydrogenase subunit gamma [Methanobacteriaceae archaeon]
MFSKIKEMLDTNGDNKNQVKNAPSEKSKPVNKTNKPRIGYIHLSGCTGDGMSLTENYDILATLLTDMVDIVYGQTLVDEWDMPEMDLCLVEGSVCLQDEHSVHELKEAREKSKLICAFGSCAMNGCFTTYSRGGQQAQPKQESFSPINSLVKVDLALPGCPVSPEMIAKSVVAYINNDNDYLKPAIDIAACNTACGCDLLTGIISKGLCTGCGTCGLACQTRAIEMIEGRPHINTDRCIKCGACYASCPRSWLPEKQIKKELNL